MDDAPRQKALAARDVDGLLHAVVADVGESLELWSVDLWAFSGDADALECRAYWCRDQAAALAGDCMQSGEDADELAGVAGDRLATARAAGGDRVEPPPEPQEEDEQDEAPEGEPA